METPFITLRFEKIFFKERENEPERVGLFPIEADFLPDSTHISLETPVKIQTYVMKDKLDEFLKRHSKFVSSEGKTLKDYFDEGEFKVTTTEGGSRTFTYIED